MSKGVGKALEAAISSKSQDHLSKTKEKEGRIEFLNSNRQEIFSYLCSHPCSYTSMISKATHLSLHTVNWHLRRLLEAEYVVKSSRGKKTVFYPNEMISSSDVPILEELNSEKAKKIYILIAQNNGIFQSEICNKLSLKHQAVIWYTKKLESLDLITSLEDGKFRRYYPTELLKEKNDENSQRIKIFKRWLQNKLQTENLSPVIIRSTEDKFVIRISRGTTKAVLTLSTNPFVTVLS
jgi:predicted transcriptional regulator